MEFILDKLSDRAKTNFAEVLRAHHARPVYQVEAVARTLRGLARSCLTTGEDVDVGQEPLRGAARSCVRSSCFFHGGIALRC